MAEVVLTEDALKDLQDLDGSARKKVAKALKKLAQAPEQLGEPLGSHQGTGSLTGHRKLTVGNREFRIGHRAMPSGDLAIVFIIGRRTDAEVYDLAVARLLQIKDDETLVALAARARGHFQP